MSITTVNSNNEKKITGIEFDNEKMKIKIINVIKEDIIVKNAIKQDEIVKNVVLKDVEVINPILKNREVINPILKDVIVEKPIYKEIEIKVPKIIEEKTYKYIPEVIDDAKINKLIDLCEKLLKKLEK